MRLIPGHPEPPFPSEKHYERLKAKGFDGRKDNAQDLWWWHAYDYGWRRIMMQTRDDNSPIDPKRERFDRILAAEAEIFYAKKLGKRAPDIAVQRPPPMPEQIAHVAKSRALSIATVKMFKERNLAAQRADLDENREAIKRAHEALGVVATETRVFEEVES